MKIETTFKSINIYRLNEHSAYYLGIVKKEDAIHLVKSQGKSWKTKVS
jgi:hypothetical protein